MPPKNRVKSGAGSALGQKWEQALMTTAFCDEDKWAASVSLVVGSDMNDSDVVDIIGAAVASGIRRLFSIISRQELLEQVNELGNPKGKKPKEIPANSEICEAVKPFLDNGEEIPLPLLAKLLKWRLLDIKQKDLRRRETEKKGGIDGKTSPKKGDKKDRAKSPAKGKGGKKTPEPSAKGDTKLKKRGEEDINNKYIDDEPDDGPQHYIIITGFHHPHLPSYLDNVGVALDCIIKVSAEDPAQLHALITTALDAPEQSDENPKVREQSKLEQFWRDVLPLMQAAPDGSKLHDVALLQYLVTPEKLPESLQEAEKNVKFGAALFEDVACMIYDLYDVKRLWRSYLDNLKLIHVPLGWDGFERQQPLDVQSQAPASTPGLPAETKTTGAGTMSEVETKTTKSCKEADMRYYNELMSNIPQESVSVPLIMHCMLEQVVAWEEDKEPPSEVTKPPRADGLDESLAQHISNMVFKLSLSADEAQVLQSEFDPPKKKAEQGKQPNLIYTVDGVSKRLQHLDPIEDLNPQQAELDILHRLPISQLYQIPTPSARLSREKAARQQEMLHFITTEGLTQGEIEHAFKQFVFECMEMTGTDSQGNIVGAPTSAAVPVPWDDPYPLFQDTERKLQQLQQQLEADVEKQQFLAEQQEQKQKAAEALQAAAERVAAETAEPERPSSRSRSRGSSARNRRSKKSSRQASPVPAEAAEPATTPTSRPASGILKSRSSSASSHKSSASVHFEDGELEQRENHVEDEAIPDLSMEDIMAKLQGSHKRLLDQWCFTEHLAPEVLVQVLWEASYSHPYIDTYYHAADHTLLVALHNPIGPGKLNQQTWSAKLYSDVGFRNYLEHIAEMTNNWSKLEDARYDATVMAKEVQQITKDAEAASRPSSAKDKKGKARSKSPKKPGSRAGSSQGSSTERPTSGNLFIRAGSLKAAKAEMEQLRRDQEEADRAKHDKHAKLDPKKLLEESEDELESLAEEVKDKKAPSRSSSKALVKDQLESQSEVETPRTPEPTWPFTGYDMGNTLLHVTGESHSLFPADGGQIRADRTEFAQGSVSVKAMVLKDGHRFLVHVLDPKSGEAVQNEKEETEQEAKEQEAIPDEEETEAAVMAEPSSPAVGRFGSFTAQYSNGLTLSCSVYGASGECAEGKRYEPQAYEVPIPRSPSPSKDTGKAGGKGKGKTQTPEPTASQPEEEQYEDTNDTKSTAPDPSYLHLHVTTPDGLCTTFLKESANEGEEMLVKQSYPFKTRGMHEVEMLRKKAMEESHRIITPKGQVIKFMNNGLVTVLFGDGQVTELSNYPPPVASRTSSPQRPGSVKSQAPEQETPTKRAAGGKGRQKSGQAKEAAVETVIEDSSSTRSKFVTTLPSGQRFVTKLDGSTLELKDLLVCYASDPYTGQVVATREDKVVTVKHPDGKLLVEHSDGTRITTHTRMEQVATSDQNALETGEDPEMNSREIRTVTVECPGYATVIFDTSMNEVRTQFGDGSVIVANPACQYDLHHHDGSHLQVNSTGLASYTPRHNHDLEVLDSSRSLQYVMSHFEPDLVKVTDNEGTTFVVKNTGEAIVNQVDDSEEEAPTTPLSYKQHAPMFFILHPDGSGTGLLRYQDIASYIERAEDDPATAILMDPLVDHPGVLGITILKPYLQSLSKQWITPYAQPSILPQGLTSRDLKTLPAHEYKREGAAFGTTVGQGLQVGNIVHPAPRPPVLKCPNQLELRQLLQYKPVSQDIRTSLLQGMRQYGEYVLQRAEQTEMLLVQDPRSHVEKMQASLLQKAATIAAMQDAPNIRGDLKHIYEQATAPALQSPPLTPMPKRSRADWEKDQREIQEEQANRQALRNQHVPPYFESELGKAFLLSQLHKELALEEAPDMAALARELAQNQPVSRRESESQPGSNQSVSLTPDCSPTLVQDPVQPACSAPPPAESCTITDVNDHRSMSSTPAFSRDVTGNTPSTLRPVNPTPAHAVGQGSPAPIRPFNPTPAHADQLKDRPVNPTPKMSGVSETASSHNYPSIQEQPQEEGNDTDLHTLMQRDEEDVHLSSLEKNVTGERRDSPVRVPAYITKSGRPTIAPNLRFQQVEEPVRRQVYTSSTLGAKPQGAKTLQAMRGFQLLPQYVNFGVLKEGNTYGFNVHLKNMGVDTCRFKIQQPPPSTGMKVLYQPGPVAAGMKATLQIQIYAMAVGVEGEEGVGKIEHKLLITTETDHLYLPVTATVYTAHTSNTQGRPAPGVTLLSTKPPAGQGIIRPAKHYAAAIEMVS